MKCEDCQTESDQVERRKSMTMYVGKDITEDGKIIPDSGPVLCNDCHAAYLEYWSEMWNEYYSSLL